MAIALDLPALTASTQSERMQEPTLLDVADALWERLPDYRVEIIGGRLTVTPAPDAMHARALMNISFLAAELNAGETELFQGIGVWLGNGENYAVPDFAIADADLEDHMVKFNCYAPSAFRAVLEVTSTNRTADLVEKRAAYAEAGIPVYVVVDRKVEQVLVLTEPKDDDYRVQGTYERGDSFQLPESVGGAILVEVDLLLGIKRVGKPAPGAFEQE